MSLDNPPSFIVQSSHVILFAIFQPDFAETLMADVDYRKVEGFESVDAMFFNKVEDYAAGMDTPEILAALNVPRSRLNAVEQEYLEIAFNIGRGRAKKMAVDNLFASMRDKGGHAASLAYLVRFADKWTEEGSGVPAVGAFTFTVNKPK